MCMGGWIGRRKRRRSVAGGYSSLEPTAREFRAHVRMTVDRLDGATEDEIADVDERFVWWLINNGYITYEIDAKGNAVFSYTGRPV